MPVYFNTVKFSHFFWLNLLSLILCPKVAYQCVFPSKNKFPP